MREGPQFLARISEEIWESKYRFRSPDGRAGDQDLAGTFRRIARAVAAAEAGGRKQREAWEARFFDLMSDFGFLPAGRIIAGAGTGRSTTLFNCFVMGPIGDDLGSIFDNVKEAALTMQQGGGIGHDFSTLRPKGALVRSIGADASGPVSFMDVWDAMCRTIMSAGARRGAMMGTLAVSHPDIETFIDAKSVAGRLTNFNLSVLVPDRFMAAVAADGPWDLEFEGKVYRTVRARALWERIMRAAYDYAEPGVIFIDRVNEMNNLGYCEEIRATNPCGEQPLPAYGACLLGSINLARLVEQPFEPGARLDTGALDARVRTAVRFLDNVIDVSNYPLPEQRNEALAKRRIGLGITGLADALILSGVRYGSDAAVKLAAEWMAVIERAAYLASADLAAEKGVFPLFDRDAFLARPNIRRLPAAVQDAIRKHGVRNGCLTSIAPTGTISLFAGNVSSGIEPVFDYTYRRRVLEASGGAREEEVEDHAYGLFRNAQGAAADLPAAFVRTEDLTPREHLVMQAALQRHVDSSISKTINCPREMTFDAFKEIYREAYELGLKGCTAYRPNAITGAVLTRGTEAKPQEPPEEGSAPQPVAARGPLPVPDRVGDVVYMAKPLDREPVLQGYTYKLRWPGSDHALYVTINDIERDGRRRPFEIFINTRNLEHYAWTVALTRMISAVFRRGGDVAFVADELKAVFDPQGGRWMGGRYVPSLLAAIGEVIETHMVRIGFLAKSSGTEASAGDFMFSEHATLDGERGLDGGSVSAASLSRGPAPGGHASGVSFETTRMATPGGGRSCPRCGSSGLVREGQCWTCRSCGFSRCG